MKTLEEIIFAKGSKNDVEFRRNKNEKCKMFGKTKNCLDYVEVVCIMQRLSVSCRGCLDHAEVV